MNRSGAPEKQVNCVEKGNGEEIAMAPESGQMIAGDNR
jgi:hypothetical protein